MIPGFGDTPGIEKDDVITNEIGEFFLFKTGEINTIFSFKISR